MKCPNWGKILAAAALCAALCACSKPQDVLPDHTATPETSATVAPTAAVVQATATHAPTDTTVPTILPQTADAGRSYVDDTLFIGDSNTVRYTMYADDTGTAFSTLKNNIGVVSMGAGSITTLKCEKFKGDSTLYTIPDAVAKLQPKRIIIGFGSNNLGGSSTDATKFIAQYREGLAAITKAWPYADIIVSAIPPLDQQRDNTNLTMTQVDAYNAALVTMCEEDGYKFLNTAEVLRDDATGWAKKDYTLSDGVHLSKEAVTAYFIMGRSENSRNRVFVEDGEGIRTQAFDPSKLTDPSLIIYAPVRVLGNKTIVTNGDQTDTIYEGMDKQLTFEQSLRSREFEPDGPNYTPRISGVMHIENGNFNYAMSILKSNNGNPDGCNRYTFAYENPAAGEAHFIHTYMHDGNPLPSFEGEPKLVEAMDNMEEFADLLWNSLNEENKVSLFVRYIDIETGNYETKIVNKNK